MFCKHCGEKVDAKNGFCSHCGKPIEKLENGNGFWDIGKKPEIVPAQNNTSANRDFGSSAAKPNSKKNPIPTIIGGVGLLLGLCAIALATIFFSNLKKVFSDRIAAISDQIISVKNEAEDRDNSNAVKSEKSIADLWNAIGEIEGEHAQPTEETIPMLMIVASPVDIIRESGFTCSTGEYLFNLEVEGFVSRFVWQKQLSDGKWEQIEFDSNGICKKYGFRLDESIELGYSRIIATGLNEDSTGSYKCIIIGMSIDKEIIVHLAVVDPNTPEPLSTPEPTPVQNSTTPDNSENPIVTSEPAEGR